MKALLIYPPKKHMIKTNVPEFVDKETGLYPPLGLLYVAGFARENSSHEIKVLDAQAEGMDYAQIEDRIRQEKPDIVGIQAFTFALIDVIRTAKIAKKVDKNIMVCLGGPHVNIYPEETISMPEVDFLVMGEGEVRFTKLLNALDKKERLEDIDGIFFKDGLRIVRSPAKGYVEDLDSLAFPARGLTPYEKYYSLLAKSTPVTTMMTSRGCPFRCLFCDRPHLGKKFRSRSAANVVKEMEACVKMGIREFFLYDDTFSVDKKRAHDICDEILKKGLDIGWDIRTRVDTVDEDLLRKLKKAGCERVHYGVEAGTKEILKVLRKDIDLERVKYIFKKTKSLGMTTLAYFMFGSPTETKDQILKTIDFAIKLDPDFVHFSITTPFPATELYYLGLERGILKKDYWKEFASSPDKGFVPEIWEENLSKEELSGLLKFAYKRFYTRPGYIIKELFKVRSIGELLRKLKAGLNVIKS
ncbi:MAG: B12-binding domain-containing radical SAM protein [Candidatus Omnitrophica bacterium]|nr:B12-binding domain-containing radical SAM protein [Candidatus Omnitrophota bacterium]